MNSEIKDGIVRLYNVHPESKCAPNPCVIHNPTNHHMCDWNITWRDKGIVERICPDHGVGHPDPDQFQYWRESGQDWLGVHGCCGCCYE